MCPTGAALGCSLQPGTAGPVAASGGAAGAARMLSVPGMDKCSTETGRDALGAWHWQTQGSTPTSARFAAKV